MTWDEVNGCLADMLDCEVADLAVRRRPRVIVIPRRWRRHLTPYVTTHPLTRWWNANLATPDDPAGHALA